MPTRYNQPPAEATVLGNWVRDLAPAELGTRNHWKQSPITSRQRLGKPGKAWEVKMYEPCKKHSNAACDRHATNVDRLTAAAHG